MAALAPQGKGEGLGYSPRVHHPEQGVRIEAAENIDDLQVVVQHCRAGHAMVLHHPQNVDVFRRLDAHILLGVMDARGISQPFFFTLRREGSDVDSRASSLAKI